MTTKASFSEYKFASPGNAEFTEKVTPFRKPILEHLIRN